MFWYGCQVISTLVYVRGEEPSASVSSQHAVRGNDNWFDTQIGSPQLVFISAECCVKCRAKYRAERRAVKCLE
jgi:hypothetical protein